MVRYVRFYTRWHRRENDQFSTLRCTKTGSTQPKLSAACFVVQSCLADADFVVFSNYCLIGTRQRAAFFRRRITPASPLRPLRSGPPARPALPRSRSPGPAPAPCRRYPGASGTADRPPAGRLPAGGRRSP